MVPDLLLLLCFKEVSRFFPTLLRGEISATHLQLVGGFEYHETLRTAAKDVSISDQIFRVCQSQARKHK
jgi:hypothetical protein